MSHFKGPDLQEALPNFQANTSVLKLLVEALRRNGDSIAMVEGQTGETASFKDILQQGTSIAAGLRSAGVTAGDYVVICGDKSIMAYSVFVGIIFTGATAVMFPIPHANIVDKLTEGFPIKAVFCDPELLDTLKKSIRNMKTQPTLVAVLSKKDKAIESLLKTSTETFKVFEARDLRKFIPMIFFSSGTTGDPKGIQLTDVYVQTCGTYFNHNFKTFLTASPLYWLSGLIFFLSSAFYNYKVILSNSSKPCDNLQLIETYKVDGWMVGTGSLSRYVYEPNLDKFDLRSVKKVFTGGECVLGSSARDFVSKVLRDRLNLNTMYGSTEVGLLTSVEICQKNGLYETGVCGRVLPGCEIKVVDDNSKLVKVGTLGEIRTKSLSTTPGYWGRPDLTEEAFDKDGFFRTGDAGFFDEGGNLYLRGRFGDLINFRETKVSPAEVEDVLMSHEAVLDAAVVGKPHPADNQHLPAFVVRAPGLQVSEQQLENFVHGKVGDRMKIRGGVHFMDILPRTIIGKIQRKKLREISKIV